MSSSSLLHPGSPSSPYSIHAPDILLTSSPPSSPHTPYLHTPYISTSLLPYNRPQWPAFLPNCFPSGPLLFLFQPSSLHACSPPSSRSTNLRALSIGLRCEADSAPFLPNGTQSSSRHPERLLPLLLLLALLPCRLVLIFPHNFRTIFVLYLY